MTSLKDIITHLKFELEKGENGDRELITTLVDRIEPIASRDWARIKRLERRTEAFSGKSPEELEKIISETDSLKAELETAKNLLADKEKLLEAATRQNTEKETLLTRSLNEEKAAVTRLLLDSGLTAELSKANVKPSLIGAAKALIREKGILSVEGEGEIRTAVARIRKDGIEQKQNLPDWVKDFLTSEEGKEFIAAKENAGGGAGEHRAPAPGDVTTGMVPEQFWGLPAKERAAFIAHGGTLNHD
jgi:hypothetical protein